MAFSGWATSSLSRLHLALAIALALRSSITQSLVNTRKQWPTYLTSGSCTSRHSTIALLMTLTLFTFAMFGVARRSVEAPRRSAITAARALRRMDGSRAERRDVPRARGVHRRQRSHVVPELEPGPVREQRLHVTGRRRGHGHRVPAPVGRVRGARPRPKPAAMRKLLA